MSDLKQIFDLLDFPKEEARPPATANVKTAYGPNEYIRAVRELGNLRLKPTVGVDHKTGEPQKTRKVYLCDGHLS